VDDKTGPFMIHKRSSAPPPPPQWFGRGLGQRTNNDWGRRGARRIAPRVRPVDLPSYQRWIEADAETADADWARAL